MRSGEQNESGSSAESPSKSPSSSIGGEVWLWQPREDISLYELAEALGVLLPATAAPKGIAWLSDAIATLPPTVARHFTDRNKS